MGSPPVRRAVRSWLSSRLAPSDPDCRRMLRELREACGVVTSCAILYCTQQSFRGWLSGSRIPALPTRRAIWLCWTAVCRPELNQTLHDWLTWGRYAGNRPRMRPVGFKLSMMMDAGRKKKEVDPDRRIHRKRDPKTGEVIQLKPKRVAKSKTVNSWGLPLDGSEPKAAKGKFPVRGSAGVKGSGQGGRSSEKSKAASGFNSPNKEMSEPGLNSDSDSSGDGPAIDKCDNRDNPGNRESQAMDFFGQPLAGSGSGSDPVIPDNSDPAQDQPPTPPDAPDFLG